MLFRSKFKNSQEYEEKCPDNISDFIKDQNDEISVFLDGSEAISGIILKFLEKFKERDINVYYIRSDLELLGKAEKLQDKITSGILQEYTRSGLFNKLVFFDKIMLEKLLNNVSLIELEDKLSDLISTTCHYVNVYENVKPILSNSVELSDISRLQTYGLGEIGTGNINWFSNLENVEEIIYYFAINLDTLKKEKNLLNTIKAQVKEKQKENIKVLFNIYETSYEQNYVYCCAKTKIIQQPNRA